MTEWQAGEHGNALRAQRVASPADIDAAAWNALLARQRTPTPFMRHEYLAALHASGSAVRATGWTPRFQLLWDGDQLAAACPLYLKTHSYGEYVFDWAWANAYAEHGLAYYPKALVAVPFTPVPGSRLLARDAAALEGAILLSCRHKADIVARDETERGDRALLNFGHTFGHALEVLLDYGTLLHGEAVAIGMQLAADFSVELGHADIGDRQRLRALLTRFGLPVRLPAGIGAEAMVAKMRLDKKAAAGRLRLILWRGLGKAFIADDVDAGALTAFLSAQSAGN